MKQINYSTFIREARFVFELFADKPVLMRAFYISLAVIALYTMDELLTAIAALLEATG